MLVWFFKVYIYTASTTSLLPCFSCAIWDNTAFPPNSFAGNFHDKITLCQLVIMTLFEDNSVINVMWSVHRLCMLRFIVRHSVCDYRI